MGHHKQKELESRDKSRAKRQSRGRNRPEFRGFVSYHLKTVDKADYARFELTEDFAESLLPDLLAEGYRISFSVDARTDSFMAAISTKNTESSNAGLVLTARSGESPYQAGMRAIYMHLIIFNEEWPDPEGALEYVDEWAVDPPDPTE